MLIKKPFGMVKNLIAQYPHTFWILLISIFINRVAASLVWPFLADYMHGSLGIALALTTVLISIQSVSALVSTTIFSPIMDRVGRKRMMIIGLIATSVMLVIMSLTTEFILWVGLIAIYGAVNQIANVGGSAVVADIIEPEHRAEAYAMYRMVGNLGIAIGPAIGGFLISAFSFSVSFYITAICNVALALVIFLVLPETIPQIVTKAEQKKDGGFWVIFRDRLYVSVTGLYILTLGAPSIMFSLLLIYVKRFDIMEDQYGFLIMTNAVVVVLFQWGVTFISKRFPPFLVMALGALLYAVGVGSIALGTTFAAFWISIVVITSGEMLVDPTVVALVANIAPPDKRARYMGIISTAYQIAAGFAPFIGGALGQYVAPEATWYGGMVMALLAMGGFLMLARKYAFASESLANA